MKRSTRVLFAALSSLALLLAPAISEARGGHGGHGGGSGRSSGFHGGFRGGYYGGRHGGVRFAPRHYGGSTLYFGSYYPPLGLYAPGYYGYGDPYYYSGPPASYYPPPPADGAVPAAPQDSVVVAVDQLNVRSGPGEDQPVVAQVSRGVVLPVLGSTPGWWYVRLSNDTFGWVESQFTSSPQKSQASG